MFLMHCGFAMLSIGCVRAKFAKHISMLILVDALLGFPLTDCREIVVAVPGFRIAGANGRLTQMRRVGQSYAHSAQTYRKASRVHEPTLRVSELERRKLQCHEHVLTIPMLRTNNTVRPQYHGWG